MGGEPVEKVKTLAVEAAAGADRGAAEPSTVGAATRMMSVVVKAEDNNGSSSLALADVEEELAKFAQAAASNPVVSTSRPPETECLSYVCDCCTVLLYTVCCPLRKVAVGVCLCLFSAQRKNP